jgi:hypothetical protein
MYKYTILKKTLNLKVETCSITNEKCLLQRTKLPITKLLLQRTEIPIAGKIGTKNIIRRERPSSATSGKDNCNYSPEIESKKFLTNV